MKDEEKNSGGGKLLSRYFLSRLYEELKKFKDSGEELSFDSLKECIKRARGHAGGKAKADKKMEIPTTNSEGIKISLIEHKFSESGQTGWMIALFVNPETGAQIAFPGGEAVEDLHLTLCMLGDASVFDQMTKARVLVMLERFFKWQEPLSGEISGLGRFQSGDGIDVIYASVDVPGLDDFRANLVRRLREEAGVKVSEEHGFDPHITLAYITSDAPTPEWNVGEIPIRFDRATSAFGTERIDFEIKSVWLSYRENGHRSVELSDLANKLNGLTRVFMELQAFAEPPEWIPYLPIPGKYTSPVYGEIVITQERNQRFVSNFNEGIYQEKIPVDCEHETKVSGACGWITKMRVNTDGSVDAKVDWTDRGVSLIESDRFKYFSPEWFTVWTDPATEQTYEDVAIGGALTTRPFFKEGALRPLVANERGLVDAPEDKAGGTGQEPPPVLPPAADNPPNPPQPKQFSKPATEPQIQPQTKEGKAMSEPNKATQPSPEQFAEMQTKLQAAEAAAESARVAAEENKKAAETAQADARKANERVLALELSARNQRFKETAKGFFGETAKHVSFMEKLADKFGEESEELKEYVEQQRSIAAQLEASDVFNEKGRTGTGGGEDSATAMAEAKVKVLMEKNPNLSKNDALSQVFKEDPKLYQRYREESSIRP